MLNPELAPLFYREILKIHENSEFGVRQKVTALYQLLKTVMAEVTKEERIHFTTLFARIAFVCHKYKFNRQIQFQLHAFRRAARLLEKAEISDSEKELHDCLLGFKVTAETILIIFGQGMPTALIQLLPADDYFQIRPPEITDYRAKVRVVVVEDDTAKQQLLAMDEDNNGSLIRVQYAIAERNENFNPTIRALRNVFKFPVIINLLDVEIDQAGTYRPRAFVVEPDYLLDVTAVAECFKDYGADSSGYLLGRMLPYSTGKSIMIGNIANFFLDELMAKPDWTFEDLFPNVFKINPLAFALFDDDEVKEIKQNCRAHFNNLKRMVLSEFDGQEIVPKNCYIEPSFYAETYGLQGRLDLFFQPRDGKKAAIVELKSGKPFKPNLYGISHNHYTQTLLYDLMVKAVFEGKIQPTNYILYSQLPENPLKFAPETKMQQYEAMQMRNQLLAIEQELIGLLDKNLDDLCIFDSLQAERYQGKGFMSRDVDLFEKTYTGMSVLERKYFKAFCSFIASEHQLAKTGVEGQENANGQAALWLDELSTKEENFNILSYLKITDNQATEDNPLITFTKTLKTNILANFRLGDVVVLYPFRRPTDTVLSNQIFKCTLIEISKHQVLIRLRSRQFNDTIFKENEFWNIEHDLFDSSFVGMYRSLFAFARAEKSQKDMLLTLRPPEQTEVENLELSDELTSEQQKILQKIIFAKNYFLLWGPPGTGKTSKMLKHLVQHILSHTDENLLLLAYTNRAVDEICEAIETIGSHIKDDYIRIGSRYSTSECFHEQLLDSKLEHIKSRKELKILLEKHRIFVATVASMSGKMEELLQLKQFHRVVVDEASQILEPNLVGLLSRFEKFVLIGDHKQLPAVVVQDIKKSTIQDADLQAIGLNNLRNSLFERLFRRCQSEGWDWAYDRLSHQGRMHQDIMNFPAEEFYSNGLKILPSHLKASALQSQAIDYQLPANASDLEKLICSQRVIFIPTPSDEASATQKTNFFEAEKIAELVAAFQNIFVTNSVVISKKTLGIITPYRAQIAQIQSSMRVFGYEPDERITIDTVERYQGGARDVVLISLCTNRISQLTSLVSLSDEGVDRKLNVAMTRARQHLVIVGNPDLLRKSPIYKKLLEFCDIGMYLK